MSRAVLAGSVALLAAGCAADNRQSVLHPASAAAASLSVLHWSMVAVLGLVFVLTMGAAAYALLRPKGARAPGRGAVLLFGAGLPSLIVAALLLSSAGTSATLKSPLPPGEQLLRVQVTGHMWWWDVEYPDHGIRTANELHLPVGRTVQVELRTADVIHSFWIPSLHGKVDMIPEAPREIRLRVERPGTWRGICAEFCGDAHAQMLFPVVALEEREFGLWLEGRRRPAPEPVSEEARRGRDVFFRATCQACHAVRGTAATGTEGPDLTLVGARLTLGAGTVPNTPESLEAWIRDSHAVKPGNLMPPVELGGDDLRALRVWLETLR